MRGLTLRASFVSGIVLGWIVACSVDRHGQITHGTGGTGGSSANGKGGTASGGTNKGGSSAAAGAATFGGVGSTGGGSGAVSGDQDAPTAGDGVDGGTGGGAQGGEDSGGAPGVGSAPRGAACSADTQCEDGHCVDGVCCESSCVGTCEACALLKTGQPDGTCAAISGGTDPDDECAKDAATCGHDGVCDGAGGCRYASSSTVCAPESCAGGRYTPPSQCDGKGTCVAPAALDCSNCAGTACNVACTSTPQCPNGFYCATSVCVAKKANGSTCTKAEECSNTSCVEGVCCDGACNSKCSSCLQANTGQPDGKCAPVKAGSAHGSDCTAAAASTCGLDGKCDGAGACRKYVAGTVCVAQSCPSGSATKSSQRTCDGNGTCGSATTSSCGNFLCDATSATCKTSCAAPTDCGSNAYCSAGSCIAKKAPGALCSSAAECSSGLCGGRCCNPGQPCKCTQPSTQNILKNPGFDKDISGWNQEAGPGGFSWQADDYEQCPFSGSAYISTPVGYSQRLWQCVAISPHTSYDFGVRYHTAEGAFAHCDVDLYPGANCTGTATNVAAGLWLNVDWGPGGSGNTPFDSGLSASARVSCYNGSDFGTDAAFYIDQIYLSPAPAMY